MMFMLHFIHGLFLLCFFHCFFVVFGSFPFFKSDRTGGTAGQTVAETVTEIFPDQLSFAIDDVDSSFMARLGAETAAVAFLFVYMYDLPNHFCCLLLLFWHQYTQ